MYVILYNITLDKLYGRKNKVNLSIHIIYLKKKSLCESTAAKCGRTKAR